MAITKVRHQADKNCRDCEAFSVDIYEDSFGPYTEENCSKGRYTHVGYYSEACNAYQESVRPNDKEE